MRKQLRYAGTVVFLIAAVIFGSLWVVLPLQRLHRDQAPSGAVSNVSATSIPTSPVLASPTTSLETEALPALTVHGSRILNANGREVTLVGASRSSLEYGCTGDGHFQVSDFAGMRAWGMNVVRLPLSSEFWVHASDSCPQYRQYVAQTVRNAEVAGLYVILDLQWDAPFDLPVDRSHGGAQCAMPDNTQDVAFWRGVAAQFAGDRQVLFDLFGEPHDISWETWYSGGLITNECDVIQAGGLTVERGTYTAIGMHTLAQLVRSIAPNNVLIVAGLDWGYDLAQAGEYDLGISNVLYDTHPFNYTGKGPSDWNRAFGALTTHAAVIAGEFGSYDCGTNYIAAAIRYFNAHHMSWLAWTWGPQGCSGPSLLAAWPAVPSIPYGNFVRLQMLSEAQNGVDPGATVCPLRSPPCEFP